MFLDGLLEGAASASFVCAAYAQGNIYGQAKAAASTKGLDLDYAAEPHMLPIHHSPTASPVAPDSPAHVAGVKARVAQGAQAARHDPHAMFF